MSTVVTKEQARKIIAVNLQQVMAERDIVQADIARAIQSRDEKLQTARQRISRYVNATADIVGDDLANICEFLDVSADWLLTNTRRKKSRHAG